MSHNENESIHIEEKDGQTCYILDDGEAKRITHAIDWGVRHPKKIRLLRDLIIVRPDPEDGSSEGGIVIPGRFQVDQYNRSNADGIKSSQQYHTGEVLAVGPGRYDSKGRRMPVGIKVGQRICYHRYATTGIIWLDGLSAGLVQSDGGNKGDAVAWVIE